MMVLSARLRDAFQREHGKTAARRFTPYLDVLRRDRELELGVQRLRKRSPQCRDHSYVSAGAELPTAWRSKRQHFASYAVWRNDDRRSIFEILDMHLPTSGVPNSFGLFNILKFFLP